MGYAQRTGLVIVCDDTTGAADARLARVLWNDPGTGVMRYANAGYETAREYARKNGLDLPMIND